MTRRPLPQSMQHVGLVGEVNRGGWWKRTICNARSPRQVQVSDRSITLIGNSDAKISRSGDFYADNETDRQMDRTRTDWFTPYTCVQGNNSVTRSTCIFTSTCMYMQTHVQVHDTLLSWQLKGLMVYYTPLSTPLCKRSVFFTTWVLLCYCVVRWTMRASVTYLK